MSEEKRAELLARWLDGAGGPPDDLDPDVVEAIHALRPDLAAPPRVDLDDILASVREGPLAVAPQGEVVPFPAAEAAGDATAARAGAPQGRARRAWPVRRWGGVGALVALAATALVVLRPAVRDELPLAGAPARELMTEPTSGRAAEPMAQKPSAADAGAPAPEAAPGLPEAQRGAVDADRARADAPARRPAEAVATGAAGEESAFAGATKSEGRAAPQQHAFGASAGGAPPAPAPADAAPREARELEIAQRAAAEKQARATVETAAEAERKGLFRRRSGDAPAAAPAAAPPPPPPPAMADAAPPPAAEGAPVETAALAEAEDLEPVAEDLGVLSRSAAPHDLGHWWQAAPEGGAEALMEELRRAEAAAAAGRGAEAAAILDPWVKAPARVGQEFARRAAILHLQDGRTAEALEVVRRGLALSDANLPERAALFWARGEILARMGDVEGARAAYRTAIALNRAR